MFDPLPAPWLTIIGVGEDGHEGLCAASQEALARAELVTGPARHLELLLPLNCPTLVWPTPFSDGIELLEQYRGKRVVMLASGDPFWFGAGTTVTRRLDRSEWIAYPVPSAFALAAAELGWALQETFCLGLHAAPLQRLRPYLTAGRHIIVLLRDGAASGELARYLVELDFGRSSLHVMEALGGPRRRVRCTPAERFNFDDVAHPVAMGIEIAGAGRAMPVSCGLPDDFFASDGQITKQPIRALTLSSLSPRAGETLWDIGAGSGSIGIEWLLAHPANKAIAFERDPVRAARARANARDLGVDRLELIEGQAPQCLPQGAPPAAVFIGGGLSQDLLDWLWHHLPSGTRLTANAVTLESEALLAQWHHETGGSLLRIELADATPIGGRHGWRSRYPLVQWSVTR